MAEPRTLGPIQAVASNESSVFWGDSPGKSGMSKYLDDELDRVFGRSFSAVLEYEVQGVLNVGLYDAIRVEPALACQVLRSIFRSQGAVDLIFRKLKEKLEANRATPECSELLRILEGAGGAPSGS